MVKKYKVIPNSRSVSVAILDKIEKNQAYSNLLVNQSIQKYQLEAREIPLLTELVYGSLQNKYALDFQLANYIKPNQRLDSWVKQLLRISIYQFIYLDSIPDHAIINESVELAKRMGHQGIGKMVNGVLRNFQRNGKRSFSEIKGMNERISIQYSLPLWIVDELVKSYGIDQTIAIAKSFHQRPKNSVRVNLSQISRLEAIERLTKEGYKARPSSLSSFGIIIDKGNPAKSVLFDQGLITIQDETSMLVGESLSVQKHHQVLDACAAPGGKTTHIADYLQVSEGGLVTALDIHKHKIQLIQENASRQNQTDLVVAKQADARQVNQFFPSQSYDRVLVDAPCSGMGLMRRKPDIRYSKEKEDVLRLKEIQQKILEETAKLLKIGGRLVYSTCTILPDENEQTIQDFLNKNMHYSVVHTTYKNEAVNAYRGQYGLTILPQYFDTDGFFIAVLERKS